MFHVEHGHFFTILNHPFTFVNCTLHAVKYYGGKFANVNSRNRLSISVLRPFGDGAFVTVFSPPRVPGPSLRSLRPVSASDLRAGRLPFAPARPLCGLRSVLPSCRLCSSFGRSGPQRPLAAAPVRCAALPPASRHPRFASAPLGAAGTPFLFKLFVLLVEMSYICD